jgi:hypothetical protein
MRVQCTAIDRAIRLDVVWQKFKKYCFFLTIGLRMAYERMQYASVFASLAPYQKVIVIAQKKYWRSAELRRECA